MSDDKDVKVDPRFDAAFQRGFDQSIPIEEYVPTPAPRRSETPAPPATKVPSPTKPSQPTAVAVEAPASVSTEVVGEDVVPSATEDADTPVELDSSPSRNPFLLLLVVVAIALVAVGVWLFVRSGDAFNSREVRSQGDYMSLDATIHMAPFIALLGAATAIGVLFVFAARWRRRR